MKKLLYLALSISLASSTLTSCINLESEMYDVINPGIFPKNEADAKALVTAAAYGPFRSNWYEGLFTSAWGGVQVHSEMTTDMADCQWDDVVWPDLINVNFTPNSPGPVRVYDYVRDISKMTLTIDRVNKVVMADETKARLIGELRCAKGWLGYILYDLFGGVPVASLEQLNRPMDTEMIPRLSSKEMFSFIETELKEAIKVLPANYKKGDSEYGRFTAGLAYTILMKLYMHDQKWAEAETCGRELMKATYGYALVDHYKDIFTLENEKNAEIIWACQCDLVTNKELWQAHVLPSMYPTKNPSIQKWSGYRMPWSFYNTFDKADERLQVLVGDFVGTDGIRYNETTPGTVLKKGALPIKVGEDPVATGEASQVDWVVYRYADVITLLSEAIVRKGNTVTQEAVDLLNMVRKRAGITEYKLSDITNVQDFMDKVLLNRGQELWFEGARRTDLIRHGKYIEFAKKYKGSITAKDYMTLMPLPQKAINEGQGKIIQNPGY